MNLKIHFSASSTMYKNDHFKYVKVFVEHNGWIYWETGGHRATTCSVDISVYPFDEQKCQLILSNWVYTGRQVNLTYNPQSTQEMLEIYQENGEWDILDITVSREDTYYDCCPDEPYPDVTYTIHLRRKRLYYIINLIIPVAMLSFMTLIVFHIPAEAGEKLSVGITLLLSYFVFMLMISESLPSTSNAVPLIGKCILIL